MYSFSRPEFDLETPLTEETIYTSTYSKLSDYYFQELYQETTNKVQSIKKNILSKSFFIFKNIFDRVEGEEKKKSSDSLNEDSLIFFHPAEVGKHQQERLVGQIQAFLLETRKFEPREEEISVITCLDCQMGLGFCGKEKNASKEFVVVMGFSRDIPEGLVTKHMKMFIRGITLFNGVTLSETDINYRETIKRIGHEMIAVVRKMHSDVMTVFHSLPFLQLPFKKNSVFIHSSQYLYKLREKDEHLLASALLHDGKIIVNTIEESVLYWLIYKAKNLKAFRLESKKDKDKTKSKTSLSSSEEEEEEEGEGEEGENKTEEEIIIEVKESPNNETVDLLRDYMTKMEDDDVSNGDKKKIEKKKKVLHEGMRGFHGQIEHDKNEITDFCLLYVEKDTIKKMQKDNGIKKKKMKKKKEFEKFPKFIQNNEGNGEFIFCTIDKYESICLIRLFELNKLLGSDEARKGMRKSLMNLKKKLKIILKDSKEDDFDFIQKDEMKILNAQVSEEKTNEMNGKSLQFKAKENIFVYDDLTKTISGNFREKKEDILLKFARIHDAFENDGVTKVVLKNSKEYVYGKKVFDNEVFYSKERKKEEETSFDDLEKDVKKKVRKEFKINLF